MLAELLAAARTQAGKARGSSSNLAGAVSGGGGDGGGGSEEGELMDADADLAPGAKRRASPVQVRHARQPASERQPVSASLTQPQICVSTIAHGDHWPHALRACRHSAGKDSMIEELLM